MLYMHATRQGPFPPRPAQTILVDLRLGLQFVHNYYLDNFDSEAQSVRSLHVVLFVLSAIIMGFFAMFLVGACFGNTGICYACIGDE